MAFGCFYCQCPCCIGNMRFLIVMFCLLAILLAFSQRGTLNITIVEMIDQEFKNATCGKRTQEITIENIVGGKVEWTEVEQGYNLGSFFIGYVITHIPAGILCDKFGPKYPLLVGMCLSSISTALIPLGATIMDVWWIVCILRFITGFGQGAIIPSVTSLITRWIPPIERTVITSLVFAANACGIVLGQLCTGLIIHLWKSWTIGFYIWAGIGCFYCLLMLIYVFSDPQTHPHIHPSEFEYLRKTMEMKEDRKTPYKKILQDVCVYGLIIMELGHALLLFALVTNFPKYLNQVLGLDIWKNSLLGLCFLLQWASGFFGGVLADYLIRQKNINITLLRKLYTLLSNVGAYTFICFAVLSGCRMLYALICFAMAILFKGLHYSGGFVNVLDISINHSGFVMSLVNGSGAFMGFLCSLGIGILAQDNTFDEWELILGIMGVLEVISIFLYLAMSNAKRRSWDYPEDEEPDAAPLRKRWYKNLTDSDHQLRIEQEKEAHEEMKETARAAKEKMRADIRNRRIF